MGFEPIQNFAVLRLWPGPRVLSPGQRFVALGCRVNSLSLPVPGHTNMGTPAN